MNHHAFLCGGAVILLLVGAGAKQQQCQYTTTTCPPVVSGCYVPEVNINPACSPTTLTQSCALSVAICNSHQERTQPVGHRPCYKNASTGKVTSIGKECYREWNCIYRSSTGACERMDPLICYTTDYVVDGSDPICKEQPVE
jgi:hypothetical protein